MPDYDDVGICLPTGVSRCDDVYRGLSTRLTSHYPSPVFHSLSLPTRVCRCLIIRDCRRQYPQEIQISFGATALL